MPRSALCQQQTVSGIALTARNSATAAIGDVRSERQLIDALPTLNG